ncbi:MAG: hypothetical protein P1V81_04240 [Planctomycetota bacterium]|nr:hypothetical protein [Planctomycetota bacterium]
MPSKGPSPRDPFALLFPARPRRLPGHRAIKILLRAMHALSAGILVGAYLLDASPAEESRWLLLTVGTGCLMLLLDLVESAAFLLQVRGVVLVVKLIAVAALGLFGDAGGEMLAAVFLLAVVSSHAPSKVRYHLLVSSDRIKGATSKG